MRKLSLLVAAAATALLPSAHAGTGTSLPALPPIGAAEAPLFAAGGTPVSNGIFFPGTALCADEDCYGEPYEIARGTDIRFYNLDHAAVANSHRIVSKDTKKRSQAPLFQSDNVSGPGSTLMKTSHLKPGVYEYFCTVHFGMQGRLSITE
ncbi:MAG TPA: plastocyanin/azurin family copper-binding protein [Actinomycetota bacterium]|nr:plastocyanin/azurin family copper-binding protein [Actinomycetota bacterium]